MKSFTAKMLLKLPEEAYEELKKRRAAGKTDHSAEELLKEIAQQTNYGSPDFGFSPVCVDGYWVEEMAEPYSFTLGFEEPEKLVEFASKMKDSARKQAEEIVLSLKDSLEKLGSDVASVVHNIELDSEQACKLSQAFNILSNIPCEGCEAFMVHWGCDCFGNAFPDEKDMKEIREKPEQYVVMEVLLTEIPDEFFDED